MTAQDRTKKKQQKAQQKQRKMNQFKLLTLKEEFLKASVSLETAFAVETHLADDDDSIQFNSLLFYVLSQQL
jgi:hypothetical protein